LSVPYDKLWNDYRPYPNDQETWDLYVKCNTSGPVIGDTDVTISWDTDEVNFSEYWNGTVELIYLSSVVADMLTEGSYTFNASFDVSYHFQIRCNVNKTTESVISLNENWNMLSLPFNESVDKSDIIVSYGGSNYTWQQAVDNGTVLDFIYGWNATSQSYITEDILYPGYGYWAWAYDNCELILSSEINTDDFITDLEKKWNMMGITSIDSLDKEDLIIRYNGTDYSWDNATSDDNEEGEPLILGFIYGWDRSMQNYLLSDDFDPGYGYWMYAYYKCTLKK